MRISDWSSDVCSSDLVPAPNAIASVAISLPSDGRSLRHELHLATFYLFGKHFAHQLQREEVREDQAEHPALHHLAQHVAAQIAQLGLVDNLQAAVDLGLLTAVAGGDADLAVHQQVGLFKLQTGSTSC